MSHDLQVWSTERPELPSGLPERELWKEHRGVWVRGQSQWQIVVGPVHRVEPEDVPDAVRALLPGISYMVELNLEPAATPKSARAVQKRVAKALATGGHGVVVDLQADTAATPAGICRFVAAPRGTSLTALQLSWFSADARCASRDGLSEMVERLSASVPEALPVRYGPYEPPPFRYSETGRQHFVDFLAEEFLKPENLGNVVWYPKRPVVDVNVSIGIRRAPAGWRCHRLTLTLEATVLEQSGWTNALQQLWRRMAQTVRAFYADVRLLRRYRIGGATADEYLDAQRHPVCGPFWAGIPQEGACAVALGPPYLALWPEFGAVAEQDGNIGFLSQPSWLDGNDVLIQVGGVPDRLAQQSPGYDGLGPNRNRIYPREWPFSEVQRSQG